jgi:polyisoprenyl-phosphate glycosyltransferase
VPCYNEAEGLELTVARLLEVLDQVRASGLAHEQSLVCLVDDGSSDATWDLICAASQRSPACCGVRLTRNFGHQNALLAGLLSSPGDVLISLDADLQDDPSVVEEMLLRYRDGADVVYAVRSDRSSDGWWKKAPAWTFYKLLASMGVEVIPDHADYRLLSRRVIESLRGYREVNLYLRGLVPQLGYARAVVHYRRMPRHAGESKYPLRRMLALALNGITSFSPAPLRIIAFVGVVLFFGSLVLSAWALGIRLLTDRAVPGWASSVLPLYFLGGIQLLSIAVVGEYVSKIYMETKARPRFLLRETVGADLGPVE